MVKTDILGVGVDDLTPEEAVAAGCALLEQDGAHYVVTPNPEFLLTAKKDGAFRDILNAADLSLPDGIGVVYAAKLLGRPLKGRVPGVDFAQGMLKRLAQSEKRLFLLGAKPGVAEQAADNLLKRYPGLIICGVNDGYFKDDGPVIEKIKASGADVVFVCLGAPKQEFWIARNGPATGAALLVGLGGCLDVFAGNVQRAPEGWQKAGMEWLYRLIKEPSRFGRMARLPLVLVDALLARFSGK